MSTTGNPTALPNFAQLFTADPTYKNYMGLSQQFGQIGDAFVQGKSPFSLQDIQGAASALQQAVQPYAQQFQEQSNREALAQRAAGQQQQQLRTQMQNALGPGATIQGGFATPVNPFAQQAAAIPLTPSPTALAGMGSTANTRTAFSSLPGASSYSAIGMGARDQNVIPLEGRLALFD